MKNIIIKGAREHNLKNIDITLPRNKFIVITGLSGSGKSTLAFDTLYAEGQRRYVESLSAYARQFLGLMNKPDVDSIEGLSPAISIQQKTTSKNPRSTVGTVTEIYDYLRLLYARIGIPHCPDHKTKIQAQSAEKISKRIQKEIDGEITVLAPIIRQKKGTYEALVKDLNKQGYTRARINKNIQRTDEKIKLDRYKKHTIEIVIDRVDVKHTSRLTEAIENAISHTKNIVLILDQDNKEHLFSSKMSCPKCDMVFEELQPRMFSFNSPFGACPKCNGLGELSDFDPDLIIPDKSISIADGAIALYKNALDGWRGQQLGAVANYFSFDVFTPISFLSEKQLDILLYGSDEKIRFDMTMKNGQARWSNTKRWEGLIPQSERLYHQTKSNYRRKVLSKFMRNTTCPLCKGKRLKRKILAVTVSKKSIAKITDMSIKQSYEFFQNLKLTKKQQKIAKQILKEIRSRLEFLSKVGLEYLTLSRNAGTLSGGEAQRIRLATQIGSNLTGVMYILDEPSIGLHQKDNNKLIDTLHKLRDLGNTLIVVEHDEDTIRRADHVIDLGPKAGRHGGKIIAQGTPKQIEQNKKSLTGKYLSNQLKIPVPKKRRKSSSYLTIQGCRQNNLKNIDVKIPTGILTLVTGVSGSGKSTLIYETLYKGMMKKLHKSSVRPGKHDSIRNGKIDKVIIIDQSPIGKTPRSNPATYTKVFDYIRKLFSQTKESKIRGYKPGRFSFNVKTGRCQACRGHGLIKIEMNFLPDVYVKCEDCNGKRYDKETLEVQFKGHTISDVLDLSVEDARELFKNIPPIKRKLDTIISVGLGYIKLGQSSTTLSGGEAQRIKLTRELSKRATGNTLYLLDEPTTGLHFHDVNKLIKVLNDLVDKGNSVVVIEHNLDVVKSADHIIDLGPDGGKHGGTVVAQGTPEEIVKNKKSYTGKFLKQLLK